MIPSVFFSNEETVTTKSNSCLSQFLDDDIHLNGATKDSVLCIYKDLSWQVGRVLPIKHPPGTLLLRPQGGRVVWQWAGLCSLSPTGRSVGLTVTLQPLTHREVGGSDSDSAAPHPQGGRWVWQWLCSRSPTGRGSDSNAKQNPALSLWSWNCWGVRFPAGRQCLNEEREELYGRPHALMQLSQIPRN